MNRFLSLLLLGVMLLLAAWPLLRPYQVAGHSAYVDLSRAEAFHQSVSNGDFTPRWVPDFYNRLGSPIFNFYAPLTYYVIESFRLCGFDGMWSLKLAYLLFWAAAVLGMFLLAGELIDWDGAAAAAAAYGVAPYLLVDIYVRVGIAEFACFAWLPWILWGIWRTVQDVGRFGPVVASLAYAGLVLTHNITAMIATPLIVGFVIVAAPDWRWAGRGFITIGLGMAASAFFWLPALAEMKYVQAVESLTGGFFHYENHFLTMPQLFINKWDYGSSRPGTNDGMGFMFGSVLWLGVLAVPALIALRRTREGLERFHLPLYFAGAAFLCLLMTQAFMSWLWWLLPLISFTQFPWRFLLPATFFGALPVAVFPALVHERYRPWSAWAMVALITILSIPFFAPRYVFHDVKRNGFVFVPAESADVAAALPNLVRPDKFLTIPTIRKLGVTSTAGHDYLPVGCTKLPTGEPEHAAEAGDEQVEIIASHWGYPYVLAEVQASVQGSVVINHFFFPGWEAKIDGVFVPISVEPGTGRMTVTVTPGRHVVELQFTDTLVRIIGKLISALAMLLIAAWGLLIFRFETL
ncbi:MAG: hypothetical protein P9L99_01650 [Candidatus Lernaella stagnicola]|nr:hypothetical protein [Candidatus Lernaella stagnicola]